MSFGDRIYKYLTSIYKKNVNNLLYAVIFAIGDMLQAFDTDFKQALAQASLYTAEGIWLDFWGFMFKVKRFHNEADSTFRSRILTGISNGACTTKAILDAVRPYSTAEPVITEYMDAVTIGGTYDAYDYDEDFFKSAFIIKVEYASSSYNPMSFYLGSSFLGYNTVVFNPLILRFTANVVEQIVKETKMAGIKAILKTVTT